MSDKNTDFGVVPVEKDLRTYKEITPQTYRNIPIETIIAYRNRGLSYRDIATKLGCSKANVIQRLGPYRNAVDNIDTIKSHRADALRLMQSVILNSVTYEDIQKAPFGQRMMGYGILFDKGQLEEGRATAHIQYADITRNIESIDAEIEQLDQELGITQDTQEIDDYQED